MSNMLIRHADADRDCAACAAIYEPFVRGTVVSFEEQAPDGRELAERIQRISRTHPWLVSEQDGAVTGYAYASPHRARAAYRWATDVTIYVAPDHHRRGVGRALYSELLHRLTEQGFHVACAGVTLPNEASIGLHRALGFNEIGTYRRIGFKFGGWHDVTWMQRELRPRGVPPQEPAQPEREG